MRRIRDIASLLIVLGGLVLAGGVVLPAVLGFERYFITSGSMTGTFDRGSIVYAETVPTSSLRAGDVITYRPPGHATGTALVTHRIVWTGRSSTGARSFRTKGDANPVADPWRFTLTRPTQARARFHVPYLGYAVAALGVREVRIAIIGLPALLIAVGILGRLWRQAGAEARRRQAAAVPDGC